MGNSSWNVLYSDGGPAGRRRKRAHEHLTTTDSSTRSRTPRRTSTSGPEGHPAGPARRPRSRDRPRDLRHRPARPPDDQPERQHRRRGEEPRLPGHGHRRLHLPRRRALPAPSGPDLRGAARRHRARDRRASAPLERRAHDHAREHRPNIGHRLPIVHWEFIADWDGLDVKCVPKGSGSENMSFLKMCVPADGVKGIKQFVLESIVGAGGKPCPPGIVGVGIGGSADYAMYLAKEAIARPIGTRNADPIVAQLEDELRPPQRDGDRPDGARRRRDRAPVPHRARRHAHDAQPGRGQLPVLGGAARLRARRRPGQPRLRPGVLPWPTTPSPSRSPTRPRS